MRAGRRVQGRCRYILCNRSYTIMHDKRSKDERRVMVHINVRLPEDVVEFYKQYPNYTRRMREVLIKFKEEYDNGTHN